MVVLWKARTIYFEHLPLLCPSSSKTYPAFLPNPLAVLSCLKSIYEVPFLLLKNSWLWGMLWSMIDSRAHSLRENRVFLSQMLSNANSVSARAGPGAYQACFFFFWHSFPMKTSSQAFVCSLCFYTLWTQHCQEEAILVMHEIRLDLCLTVESNPLNWSCYLLLWTEGLDTPCLSPVLTLEWQLQHRLFVSLGCLNPSF